jgi:hypothetical protein
MHCSHGELGVRQEFTENFRELLQVKLTKPTDPVSTSYPIRSLVSYEWIGDVYNKEGEVIEKPVINLVRGEFFIPSRVYGTIDVEYSVEKHIYSLKVMQREGEDEERSWDSVVFATYKGGVEWEEVKPSASIDVDSPCQEYWVKFVIGDDDPHYANPSDKFTKMDYCSGDLISEDIV